MTAAPWIFAIDVLGRPVTLNAERRAHFYDQAKARKAWKDAACVLIRTQRMPALDAIDLTVQPRYRRHPIPDTDAVAPSVKAVIDALVAESVLIDDGPMQVRSITYLAARVEHDQPDALIVKVERA